MGEIAAIWIKRVKRGPMEAVERAELIAGRGIAGNANQRGKGQLAVIDEAAWTRASDALGGDVDPSTRRANVMLRGLDLADSRGRTLRLGQCLIRVSGEARPCSKMEKAREGLRAAMRPEWRGGVFAEIVEGGTICVGDRAEWEVS